MPSLVACLIRRVISLSLCVPALLLSQPLWAEEQATSAVASASLPTGPSFDVTGMIGSLLFVILCIVGLTWILKRSRLVAATGQSGVSLVSQIPLSMKEKLIVVQVGNEKLLLGCTAAAINTLHSWPSAPDDENTKPPESAFAKLLAKRQLTPSATKNTGEQV
ncbi:flagellar biosynthetic protein FliO [Zhongshania aliphaticivorans]|uniref:flagellar biosynthetic protein FliO n=1 Tax=Zhongshania aliphaticivorans TaxID=1470434 RepID=UPI0012E62348|nr:flagellar biosynthetic protein FliO [Zhongshania aliphaticivorans]CAA0105143.1 Flagellar protein FliO [Zhongshania aliphaticivorans]